MTHHSRSQLAVELVISYDCLNDKISTRWRYEARAFKKWGGRD